MLSVLSSSPANQQSDVYIDAKVEITFSHELHDTSLTSDNFRIYTMPGWTGNIPLSSITKSGPVVTLIPEYDFPKDTQYVVWIRGDDDTEDVDLKGVASIISDTMDGHHQILFTTGSKKLAVENAIEEVTVTSETIEATDPIPQEALEDNDYLDIVGTYPNDLSSNVSGITSVVINFDQNIQDVDTSGGVINNVASGILEMTAEPVIFGADTSMPDLELSDVSFEKNFVLLNITDDDLSINTEYTITLFRSKFNGVKEQKLLEDYTFSFLTKLVPMYANAYGVRRNGGKTVPSSLSNSTINRYIHEASIWVNAQLGRPTALTAPIPYEVTMATIYKAICEIAKGVSMGDLRYVRDKQLADLRVMYDNKMASSLIDQYCNDAINMLAQINSDIGIKVGVKSKSTTGYPGAKRHIHNYTKHRFRS